MTDQDCEQLRRDFAAAVNMSACELEDWLQTSESQRVGWKGADDLMRESVVHAAGRRIVVILRKRASELTTDDYAHMRKAIGFVRRHSAQRPDNIYMSRWRYSLMNWGHDPIKDTE